LRTKARPILLSIEHSKGSFPRPLVIKLIPPLIGVVRNTSRFVDLWRSSYLRLEGASAIRNQPLFDFLLLDDGLLQPLLEGISDSLAAPRVDFGLEE
jgi:hypothetical protein